MRTVLLLLLFISFNLNDYDTDFVEFNESFIKVEAKREQTTKPKSFNLSEKELEEIHCLAINMYKEARGESLDGILAVARVTINRVKSSKFPSSVCNVVYQKNQRACQFSWVCMKHIRNKAPNKETFTKIKQLAQLVYFNEDILDDHTHGALYYHADYVKPSWRKRLNKTRKIGKHIFYK